MYREIDCSLRRGVCIWRRVPFPFQNKWSSVAPMSMGRSYPAVAAADSRLYVIGGDQSQEINFYRTQITISTVECYDPHTNKWHECASLPSSRGEATAIVAPFWSRHFSKVWSVRSGIGSASSLFTFQTYRRPPFLLHWIFISYHKSVDFEVFRDNFFRTSYRGIQRKSK